MFNVFKKLTNLNDGNTTQPTPMSSALQKKFSRGVNYNLKILIKGDRNVGKSCLLKRLQGGQFAEDYRPTDEIQAAAINWTYKNTDHIVKVDVWEVVDKGRSKKKSSMPLKIENSLQFQDQESPETLTLDATFLDVYKDAHGVILMFDVTKNWTYEYAMKELNKIPADIPLVVLGNHCDMQHHRQVHAHHIDAMITHANQTRSAVTKYTESSMRNGFGLRFLHKFMNIPFLEVQRRSLLQQLQTNQNESAEAERELLDFQNSPEGDYDSFTQRLTERRTVSRNAAPVTSASVKPSPSIVIGAGKPILPPGVNPLVNASMGITSGAAPAVERRQTSYVDPQLTKHKPNVKPCSTQSQQQLGGGDGNDLETFCSGALDHSFLEDSRSSATVDQHQTSLTDSDDDTTNPMVATVMDDIEDIPVDNANQCSGGSPAALFSAQATQPSYLQPDDEDDYNDFTDDKCLYNEEGISLEWNIDSSARRSPEGLEYPDGIVEPDKSEKSEKKHKSKKSKSKDKEKKKHKKSTLKSPQQLLLNESQPYDLDQYDAI